MELIYVYDGCLHVCELGIGELRLVGKAGRFNEIMTVANWEGLEGMGSTGMVCPRCWSEVLCVEDLYVCRCSLLRGVRVDWVELQAAWDREVERPFPGSMGEEGLAWVRAKCADDWRRLTS